MIKISDSNRSFGLVLGSFLLIIFLYLFLIKENLNLFIGIPGIVLITLGLLKSNLLTPFNKMWIKLGELLGVIISPIVLGLIYFFVIFPTSLLLKLFNKDILNLNFKSIDKSQWKKRKENIGTMDKQF